MHGGGAFHIFPANGRFGILQRVGRYWFFARATYRFGRSGLREINHLRVQQRWTDMREHSNKSNLYIKCIHNALTHNIPLHVTREIHRVAIIFTPEMNVTIIDFRISYHNT